MMRQGGTILYVTDALEDRSSLPLALSAAGYDVVVAHSPDQAVVLLASAIIDAALIDAALIHPSACEGGYSIAEKLKFVNPEITIVLVNAGENNAALPSCVDAATYSETPDEAVSAIAAFLEARPWTCAVA